jgi:UDP-glucose 4-epimerase
MALVTGGAGFIGSHLVEGLLQHGWSVRVLDDFSSGNEENLAATCDRIDLLRGDVRDTAVLARAVVGADVIFHLAAIASVPRSVEEPFDTHDVNLNGTVRLLEAARDAGARRVVFAASAAIYGEGEELPKREEMAPDPASPYALQKYAGECYCAFFSRFHGLETVSLRYFNVYGPRQSPGSAYASVVPLFVQATSVNQLLATIQEITGAHVLPKHTEARQGDVRHSRADVGRARQQLGFEPNTTLQEGLRDTVERSQNDTIEKDVQQ